MIGPLFTPSSSSSFLLPSLLPRSLVLNARFIGLFIFTPSASQFAPSWSFPQRQICRRRVVCSPWSLSSEDCLFTLVAFGCITNRRSASVGPSGHLLSDAVYCCPLASLFCLTSPSPIARCRHLLYFATVYRAEQVLVTCLTH